MDPLVTTALISSGLIALTKVIEILIANKQSSKKNSTETTVALAEADRKLREALDQDEASFRKALYEAWTAAMADNRQLAERLTIVTNQLTQITLERDLRQRERDEARAQVAQAKAQVAKAQAEVEALQKRVFDLEAEVKDLRQKLPHGTTTS